MNILRFVLLLCLSNSVFACYSDYDCGYGNRCVKPAGSYSLSGSCVTITDQYGNKDYNADKNWGRGGYGAKTVDSCQWNTDCNIGFKCMKEAGQLYGLCVK